MSRRKLKARDKVTQKMSRNGLVERNETKGEDIRISKREVETDLRGDTPERQSLSQADGTKSGEGTGSRTKSKQRQIGAFHEKEAARHDVTPTDSAPPITQSSDVLHDVSLQRSDNETSHTTATALRAESETQKINHDAPKSETATPSVNPRDPPNQKTVTPQHSSLSQVGTRAGAEVPQKTALRQDKPDVLKHEPKRKATQIADTPSVQQGQSGKLQTQRDSGLQHTEPMVTGVADNLPQSEQPQSDTLPVDTATKKPKPQRNEGKRRVQGNTGYRQKNIGVPLVEPATPITAVAHAANESTKPTEGNKPAPTLDNTAAQSDILTDAATQSSGNRDGEVANSSDTPPLPKQNDSKPDSQLKPDKPGKLKFASDEAAPEKPQGKPDRKLAKAERQAEQAYNKLEKAENDLPGKKKLRAERVFDEETGKGSRKLRFEKEIMPQGEHMKGALPLRPVKMAANASIAKFHSKMFQVEHENVEIKAAHRTEMAAEGGVRSALRFRKTAKYRKVAKLERQAAKKSMNLSYRKALANNPKLKSNVFSRMWQKRKLRKEYAKKARDAKRAAGAVKKTGTIAVRATRFLAKVLIKNPKVWIIAGIIGFIMIVIMSLFSLATSIGSGGMGAVLTSSYLAENDDIEAAAIAYSEWETDLRLEILNVQINHPSFNEYRFNIGSIEHCPVQLMAFLTAVYHDFTFVDIEEAMRALFDAQYTLTFTPSMEIRYAPPSEPDGDPIPFEWHIMTVTLTSRPFTEVIQSLMTLDQQLHHTVLMQTKGNRQIVGSPFDFYWFPFVSSHYGWRVHPITGTRAFHRGIDIGLPTGTPIRAVHDGVITVSQYMGGFGNVVFIVGEDGIETRYAHADTLLVNVGDEVTMGDIIATVGSTGDSIGPHLHFEILINGSHVNPAFFAFMGG